MRGFESYQEFLTTVLVFSQHLSIDSLEKINDAREYISNNRWMTKKEKYNYWCNTIHLCLWEIPQAIDIGFNAYLNEKLSHYRDALRYHDENCDNYYNCKVCELKTDMINKMSDLNDKRKRPEVCS